MTRNQELTHLFAEFLELMSIPSGNPEIDVQNTPARMARMYEELLDGYDEQKIQDLVDKFTVFDKASKHEMVVVKGTYFTSLCAHHLMPFYGYVDFGYIPSDKVVGLSKFPRAVRLFSARLQTQENLTSELADFVQTQVNPQSLIVMVKAHHMCCSARGVRQPSVEMVTSAVRGHMPEGVKTEFYRLISA